MTLDNAVQKATQLFSLIGTKFKKNKNDKIEVVSRITAFKKADGEWDIAIFFVPKNKTGINQPDCFLADFTIDYQAM